MTSGAGRRLGTGLAGAVAVVSVLTLLSRLAGFGRNLVFSATVGATCVGSAYASTNLVPTVLFEVVAGGALAAAVIPLLRGTDGDRVASALLTWAVLGLTPIALGVALFAGPLARWVVGPEQCSGQHALAASMLLAFAPQLPLYGIGAVLTGVLQHHRRFAPAALAPLLSSLVVMTGYVGYAAATARTPAGGDVPAAAFAWLAGGTTAGVVALTLPLLWPARRAGARLRPTLSWPAGVAGRAVRLGGSGVAAVLAQQVFLLGAMVLVNRYGGAGAYPSSGYVQALTMLPYAVLAVPLVTAAYPGLVSAAGSERFGAAAAGMLRGVAVAGVVAAALLVACTPAAGALFEALDRGTVVGLRPALLAAAPGVLGWALLTGVSRVLFALEAARAAAVGAGVGWVAGLAVAGVALAAGHASPAGPATAVVVVAAATSVATLAGAVLSLRALHALDPRAVRGLGRTVAGALALLAVPTAAAYLACDRVAARGGAAVAVGGAVLAGLVLAAGAAITLGAAAVVVAAGRRRAHATGTDVLLLCGPSTGGIGAHVADLRGRLVELGRRVAVVAPPSTSARFGLDAGPGWPAGLRSLPGAVPPLRTALGAARLVHAHGHQAGLLAVLVAATLPGRRRPAVVVSLHNDVPGRRGWRGVAQSAAQRVVAHRADLVTGASGDLVMEARRQGAGDAELAEVPAPAVGALLARGRPPAPERAAAAAALLAARGLPSRGPLVLTVARIAPQKRLDVVLDAAETLARQGVPFTWVILGDGDQELADALRSRADGLAVHLLGADEVTRWLAAAELFVLPSRWEARSLAVQEAMAAGVPVVAGDTGGLSDLLGRDGTAGVLVPVGDPAATARAVRALLADPDRAETLGREARRRAAVWADPVTAARRWLERYDRAEAMP